MPVSDSRLTAILGPTNTGKTFLAMERMLAHESGMIGFPLRLLARENFDRAVKIKGADAVALITGEEKIVPPKARYFICTIEAMPLDRKVALLAIDEAQLAADPERGHFFTDRLLRARGLSETIFMGSESIGRRLRHLLPDIDFIRRPRLSTLTHIGHRKLSRLPTRSAIVAFSVADLYGIADLLRQQRGGVAIVMGALSPAARNAQVNLYQSGEVDYLVATDAIGMGLNLDVRHVWFAADYKFDGRQPRALTLAEISQIAGRAGRYMSDGSFGTTLEAAPFTQEMIEAIEQHKAIDIESLWWRNPNLKFDSLAALIASLEERPDVNFLRRKRDGIDHAALSFLEKDSEIRALTKSPTRVELLWDVCQIPDYRKLMTDAHPRLLGQIYKLLIDGAIGDDWLQKQIERLDKTDGDIDHLTQRIAYVRTFSYIAHRENWVESALHWRERTRAIEDRLSEALHRALTERFIDRRRATFNRQTRLGTSGYVAIGPASEISVEGEPVGQLSGLRFILSPGMKEAGLKPLIAAARGKVRKILEERIALIEQADEKSFYLSPQGEILWQGDIIGALRRGHQPFSPQIGVYCDDLLAIGDRLRVETALRLWLETYLARTLPALSILAQATLTPQTRGIAFQIVEGLGAVPRRDIKAELKNLTPADRQNLHRLKIRLGRETLWLQGLNKRAQQRLLVLLRSLWEGSNHAAQVYVATLRKEVETLDHSVSESLLLAAGYRRLGNMAIRFERLEILSQRLRKLAAAGAIKWDAALAAALDLPQEKVRGVLSALGYALGKNEETYRPLPKRSPKNRGPSIGSPDSPFAALADWRQKLDTAIRNPGESGRKRSGKGRRFR